MTSTMHVDGGAPLLVPANCDLGQNAIRIVYEDLRMVLEFRRLFLFANFSLADFLDRFDWMERILFRRTDVVTVSMQPNFRCQGKQDAMEAANSCSEEMRLWIDMVARSAFAFYP